MTLNPQVPSDFCDYRLLEEIGRGGQGAVYRAEDTKLGRTVAIKTLLHPAFSNPGLVDEFQTEAKLAAQLNHPNVTTIHRFGECETVHFIDMEFIQGSLADRLDSDGPIPYGDAVKIAIQVCEGLQHAHPKMVHRDLKPANILINQYDVAKVTDFGLARVVQPSNVAHQSHLGLGTLEYMAPEQWDNPDITPAADIYSLGITLFEMLVGVVPFPGPTVPEFIIQHRESDVPRFPKHLGIPSTIEHIVRTALEKSPKERFSDAAEFATTLRESITRDDVPHSEAEIDGPVPSGRLSSVPPKGARWSPRIVVRKDDEMMDSPDGARDDDVGLEGHPDGNDDSPQLSEALPTNLPSHDPEIRQQPVYLPGHGWEGPLELSGSMISEHPSVVRYRFSHERRDFDLYLPTLLKGLGPSGSPIGAPNPQMIRVTLMASNTSEVSPEELMTNEDLWEYQFYLEHGRSVQYRVVGSDYYGHKEDYSYSLYVPKVLFGDEQFPFRIAVVVN